MNKLSNSVNENFMIGGDLNCSLTDLDKMGENPAENRNVSSTKLQPSHSLFLAISAARQECFNALML